MSNFALQSKMNINTFSRDSLIAIGDTLVETAFKKPERHRNKYSIRYLTMELLRNNNCVISVPQPLDTYEHDGEETPLLEGGDIEIDNGNIYVGEGRGSNGLGVQWLRNNFPDWKVYDIKVDMTRFAHAHLDCVMMIFSSWGCASFSDIVGGFDGLPEPLKQKKWIELTPEEAMSKQSNFIALNPEEVIMTTEALRLRKEVEKLGIKVHHFPYEAINQLGGGIRCSMCPICRG